MQLIHRLVAKTDELANWLIRQYYFWFLPKKSGGTKGWLLTEEFQFTSIELSLPYQDSLQKLLPVVYLGLWLPHHLQLQLLLPCLHLPHLLHLLHLLSTVPIHLTLLPLMHLQLLLLLHPHLYQLQHHQVQLLPL